MIIMDLSKREAVRLDLIKTLISHASISMLRGEEIHDVAERHVNYILGHETKKQTARKPRKTDKPKVAPDSH